MDPLSISVGILTILGSGGSVASALKQVASKHAPDALLALNNEVSDLHLIVLEISHLLQEHQEGSLAQLRTEHLLMSLGIMLGRAKEKLLELEFLIQYKLTTPSGPRGEAKLNRLAWVLEQKNAQDIRDDIRSTRTNLAAMLGILASKATLRIEFQVAELRLVNDESQAQQRAAQANTRQGTVESALSSIIGSQGRMESGLNELLTANNVRQVRPASTSAIRTRSGQERGYTEQWALQLLSIRRTRHVVCIPGCTCCCHHQSTWKGPQSLRTFLGLLFIGYTGLPLLSPKCDEEGCLEKSGPVIHMRYYFPAWFTAQAVEFFAQISKPEGLTQSLRVSQIVWGEAKIFRLCRDGDVEGLKLLLTSRKCSPYVVDSVHYCTPLDQAVKTVNLEICKVLLDAGADPHSEDIYQRTPNNAASRIILAGGNSSAIKDGLRAIFPVGRFESHGFTSIHQAVLGIAPVTLEEELHQCPSSIEDVDADGRTALSWSSDRGDLEAIKFLLHNGADINKVDNRGNAPLSHAIRCGSQSCVQLLLDHGASVNIANKEAVNPLHRLASTWDSLELLDCLISHQANMNALTEEGYSPLGYAASNSRHKVSTRLIELGADIHVKTPDGTTALTNVVSRNSHLVLKLLLQRGADHLGEMYEYGSFLHFAAEHADIESLRLLTNARLATRDIYYKDPNGLTALDVARKRSGRDLQLFNAFMKFIGSVDPVAINAGLHSVSDSEEDNFEDAVERQD